MLARAERARLRLRIEAALARSPVAVLLGPRQCGKTTLARQVADTDANHWFDLENPRDLRRLDEPMTALEGLEGTVVLDEIQRRPELFPVLRVLVDRPSSNTRFLVLGSASFALLKQTSESLAGRAAIVPMHGFSLDELGAEAIDALWLRGGFPRSFLARNETDSIAWRDDFVRLLLERDVPMWSPRTSPTALHRFWSMVAHCHGNVWKSSEPASSLGVAESTIRRYLDLLTDMLLVRQLQPWHENLKKRQVKAPKVYVRDSGLLHLLLDIHSQKQLLSHPRCGASWEGFVVEEVLRCTAAEQHYFWATHAGAELDLLLFVRGKRCGVEIKRADAPGLTKSIAIARTDLGLDACAIVYPGDRRYELADGTHVVPLAELEQNGPHVLFPELFPSPGEFVREPRPRWPGVRYRSAPAKPASKRGGEK